MKKRSVGLVLSYLNTFLSMICGLFLSSFLLNRLGDTQYGIYQTMSSFANYLVLLEFGAGTIMARNLSACRARGDSAEEIEKNISTIWTITNALSAVIALVSVIFYFSIDSIYAGAMTAEEIATGKGMFLFIIIFLLVSFYSQTLNGIALAHEDYTFASKINITKLVSRTALLAVLISNFNKAIIIVIVDATLGTALALFSFVYCIKKFGVKINFRHFEKQIFRSALPMCLAIFLQAVVNQANNNVGKFILGVKVGPEDVSLYSVGLYVFSIFSSLSTIPISLYMPQVTRNVLSGLEGKDLTRELVAPSRLMVLVSGSVLFGFFAAGRQFVSIVYGEKYLLAWAIAIILIAPMFLNFSNAVVINVLDVKNKRLMRSVIMMFTTALNIVMTLFFIDRFGIVGAAIATGLSTLIQVLVLDVYYSRAIGIKVIYMYYKTWNGILVYQIIGALLGYYLGTLVPNVYISFLVSGFTYVIVAFGGFLCFGMNESEGARVKGFVGKLVRR